MQVPLFYKIINLSERQLSSPICSFLNWRGFFIGFCLHDLRVFLEDSDLPRQKVNIGQFIDQYTGVNVADGQIFGVPRPFLLNLRMAKNDARSQCNSILRHNCGTESYIATLPDVTIVHKKMRHMESKNLNIVKPKEEECRLINLTAASRSKGS